MVVAAAAVPAAPLVLVEAVAGPTFLLFRVTEEADLAPDLGVEVEAGHRADLVVLEARVAAEAPAVVALLTVEVRAAQGVLAAVALVVGLVRQLLEAVGSVVLLPLRVRLLRRLRPLLRGQALGSEVASQLATHICSTCSLGWSGARIGSSMTRRDVTRDAWIVN